MTASAPTPRRDLRVLVVGPSALRRQALIKLLRNAGGFDAVDAAADPWQAIARAIALQPEAVAIDVDMEAGMPTDIIRAISERTSTPIILLAPPERFSSAHVREALRAGATAVIRRPSAAGGSVSLQQRREFVTALRSAVRERQPGPRPPAGPGTVSRTPARQGASPSGHTRRAPSQARVRHEISVIGVAASTGGPAALRRVLADLPPGHPPVLVVQHIGEGFAQSLSEWLSRSLPRSRVRIAQQGDALVAGEILVAPTDRHLAVDDGGRVELLDTPAVASHKPAANVLFQSLARAYGGRTLAVVLTGMGRDGADGLLRLSEAGAHTIAQDAASSVVHGMPGAAAELGAVSEMLPLEEIGPAILARLEAAAVRTRAEDAAAR